MSTRGLRDVSTQLEDPPLPSGGRDRRASSGIAAHECSGAGGTDAAVRLTKLLVSTVTKAAKGAAHALVKEAERAGGQQARAEVLAKLCEALEGDKALAERVVRLDVSPADLLREVGRATGPGPLLLLGKRGREEGVGTGPEPELGLEGAEGHPVKKVMKVPLVPAKVPPFWALVGDDLNPNHVPLDCKFKHVYVLHPTSDGDEALNLGMACVKGHQEKELPGVLPHKLRLMHWAEQGVVYKFLRKSIYEGGWRPLLGAVFPADSVARAGFSRVVKRMETRASKDRKTIPVLCEEGGLVPVPGRQIYLVQRAVLEEMQAPFTMSSAFDYYVLVLYRPDKFHKAARFIETMRPPPDDIVTSDMETETPRSPAVVPIVTWPRPAVNADYPPPPPLVLPPHVEQQHRQYDQEQQRQREQQQQQQQQFHFQQHYQARPPPPMPSEALVFEPQAPPRDPRPQPHHPLQYEQRQHPLQHMFDSF